MPKTSTWSPAEDNYVKSELLKKPSLVADDILNNLNINFQQKRTKTALSQRIKKILSDLKTIPPQPQLPNPKDNEEEYSDTSESESDKDSKSTSSLNLKPTEHLHTPLEFFGTQRLKINDPIILPLEDGSFKLVFGYSPFDIEIVEVKYFGDGRIGVKYHVLLP
ncbi:hypothetical protein ACTFIW_008751 [Dictyostelium discoideum]